MSALGDLVGVLLTLFLVVLIVRMLLDWAVNLATRLPGWAFRVRDFAHRLTEPVLAPVRRVVRPVRAGGVAFDLAFTLVFLGVVLLQSLAFSL
ncbi:YggT family protein [Amycolatopsis sp. EV170708-02-1]|uniref:YggT family protein n=1 Tax=Amycolatopsis sp. EV170708-02-1 TaxID=2919322 RepID=UPI001F0C3314|nr:YggT family protein [Amycolatopsis sp. EV170708-02-1]UMP00137.1 YggT family protein [Amycolatopsis sp. EV170708-02-1]